MAATLGRLVFVMHFLYIPGPEGPPESPHIASYDAARAPMTFQLPSHGKLAASYL